MPPRVPTEADFSSLSSLLPVALHFPSPPESTTTFLILFHGLGDYEVPFAGFAESLSLPGVLGISVRGTSPLPPSLLPEGSDNEHHFYWGDDLIIDPQTGDIDTDPGFEKASRLVLGKLINETLIEKCGWEMSDIIFFGFGEGGSLALGLASQLRMTDRVVDVTEGEKRNGEAFKGVVSVGGPLPHSMVPTVSTRQKSKTNVLVCQLEEEQVDAAKKEFEHVTVVNWKRRGVSMPRDSDEVLPIMKFFADSLKGGW